MPRGTSWSMGVVDIGTKAIVIPWLLRRALPEEVYTRREVTQVLNIPTALLLALALAITGYLLSKPLLGGRLNWRDRRESADRPCRAVDRGPHGQPFAARRCRCSSGSWRWKTPRFSPASASRRRCR